jgi:hypothetical protein
VVLGVAAFFSHRAPAQRAGLVRVGWAVAALLPLAGWMLYVRARFGADTQTGGNFALPFTAAAHALGTGARRFAAELSPGALGAVAVVVGLHVQAAYLWSRRQWADPFWRLGAAFSVLLVVLGPEVWAVPLSACRSVLPLTIAFNVVLFRRDRPAWQLFFWGNAYSLYGVFKVFTYVS